MTAVCYVSPVVPSSERRAHRFTRAEYHRMGEAGVFPPGVRLELIDGEVLEVSPQRPPHALAVHLCLEALRTAFSTGHWVRCQLPLACEPDGEPEPDVSVVPGEARHYLADHPRAALLVVEVADSTLRTDRLDKAALYARMAIPEYWILNLADRILEVHRAPTGDRYAVVERLDAQARITPLGLPGSAIAVGTLLP